MLTALCYAVHSTADTSAVCWPPCVTLFTLQLIPVLYADRPVLRCSLYSWYQCCMLTDLCYAVHSTADTSAVCWPPCVTLFTLQLIPMLCADRRVFRCSLYSWYQCCMLTNLCYAVHCTADNHCIICKWKRLLHHWLLFSVSLCAHCIGLPSVLMNGVKHMYVFSAKTDYKNACWWKTDRL